jgi:hypothetical protein
MFHVVFIASMEAQPECVTTVHLDHEAASMYGRPAKRG